MTKVGSSSTGTSRLSILFASSLNQHLLSQLDRDSRWEGAVDHGEAQERSYLNEITRALQIEAFYAAAANSTSWGAAGCAEGCSVEES